MTPSCYSQRQLLGRMPEKMNVKEIKESVDVCLPNGQLNDEAIGFSRKPIQRPNLRSWGRNRRWDFWGIVSPQFFVGMSITSLNLVHACRVYLYDRERGRELSANAETIWSSGTIQPDSPPPIAIMAEIHKTLLRFVDRGPTTQLTAMAKHLDVALTVDSEGECLGAGPHDGPQAQGGSTDALPIGTTNSNGPTVPRAEMRHGTSRERRSTQRSRLFTSAIRHTESELPRRTVIRPSVPDQARHLMRTALVIRSTDSPVGPNGRRIPGRKR